MEEKIFIPKDVSERCLALKKLNMDAAINYALNIANDSTHYSHCVDCCFVMIILKSAPPEEIINKELSTKEDLWFDPRWVVAAARVTMPTPEWGTLLFFVDRTKSHAYHVWALPNKTDTAEKMKEMYAQMGDQFVVQSITKKLSGELDKMAYSYNTSKEIQQAILKMDAAGVINKDGNTYLRDDTLLKKVGIVRDGTVKM